MLFKCRNCGGNVVYEPGRRKMYCPHCEEKTARICCRAVRLRSARTVERRFRYQDYASAGRCEHCGCYLIFNERVEGVYEPHMILPFKVNKDLAVGAMEAEFKHRMFTPADFMSAKSLEKMVGIYVPFWLYDYNAFYDFAGEGPKSEDDQREHGVC